MPVLQLQFRKPGLEGFLDCEGLLRFLVLDWLLIADSRTYLRLICRCYLTMPFIDNLIFFSSNCNLASYC